MDNTTQTPTHTEGIKPIWYLLIGSGIGTITFWILVIFLNFGWIDFVVDIIVIIVGLIVQLLFITFAFKSNKPESRNKLARIVTFLLLGTYLGFLVNFNVVFLILYN